MSMEIYEHVLNVDSTEVFRRKMAADKTCVIYFTCDSRRGRAASLIKEMKKMKTMWFCFMARDWIKGRLNFSELRRFNENTYDWIFFEWKVKGISEFVLHTSNHLSLSLSKVLIPSVLDWHSNCTVRFSSTDPLGGIVFLEQKGSN